MLEVTIPCVLTIIPGGGSTQNKLVLTTNGETVFDDYEHSLSPEQRDIAGQICSTHARVLKKFGEALERMQQH